MSKQANMQNQVLRSLIREYLIPLRLPTSDGARGGTKLSTDAASTAVKVGLTFLAGIAALNASIFLLKNKDAILSFASNIMNMADIFGAAGGDIIDIVTSLVNENRVNKIITEKDDKFQTPYGEISTDKLDPVIVKSIKTAEGKTYVQLPAQINYKDPAGFTSSMAPAISSLRSMVSNVVSIVENPSKKQNFPNSFTPFGLNLPNVDSIDDLDVPEQERAQAALTDAVATGIFNSLKNQMRSFIGTVHQNLKEQGFNDEDFEKYEEELKKFSISVADIFEIKGSARAILTGKK